MHEFIEFLRGFNVQTLLGMAIMLWIFVRHIDSKFAAQSQRTDRLYEMFIDLRRDMDQRFKETDQKFYDVLKEQRK